MLHVIAVIATWYTFGMFLSAAILLPVVGLMLLTGYRPGWGKLAGALVQAIVLWPEMVYIVLWFLFVHLTAPKSSN